MGVLTSLAIGGIIIFVGYLYVSEGLPVSGWVLVVGGVVVISLGIRAAAVGSKEEVELREKLERLDEKRAEERQKDEVSDNQKTNGRDHCIDCSCEVNEKMVYCPNCGRKLHDGSIQTYEPSKNEIISEILKTNSMDLLHRADEHKDTGTISPPSEGINPDYPTDSNYILQTLFGSRQFETEALEAIFRKLLGDDYDSYYQVARERIISRH